MQKRENSFTHALLPQLKPQVDSLWNRFWSGIISNPLTAIEQISDLIFLKLHEDGKSNLNEMGLLRTVKVASVLKRKLEEADLYEAPFTNFGSNAVEKYFTPEEIEELRKLKKNCSENWSREVKKFKVGGLTRV